MITLFFGVITRPFGSVVFQCLRTFITIQFTTISDESAVKFDLLTVKWQLLEQSIEWKLKRIDWIPFFVLSKNFLLYWKESLPHIIRTNTSIACWVNIQIVCFACFIFIFVFLLSFCCRACVILSKKTFHRRRQQAHSIRKRKKKKRRKIKKTSHVTTDWFKCAYLLGPTPIHSQSIFQ